MTLTTPSSGLESSSNYWLHNSTMQPAATEPYSNRMCDPALQTSWLFDPNLSARVNPPTQQFFKHYRNLHSPLVRFTLLFSASDSEG